MDRSTADNPFRVAALYRFVRIAEPAVLRADLAAFCCGRGIKGTLLIAPEGINGTVAGSDAAIEALVDRLGTHGLTDLEIKFSRASSMPFHRLKVRLKAEIVTMGQPGIDPLSSAGAYVDPSDWNALIADPDTIVIDTRNDYEVAIGTFRGAVDPATKSFREFPAWAEANRELLEGRKVAMFCTGGIRCEKATAYVRSLGLEDVYHLKGGILKYLEEDDEALAKKFNSAVFPGNQGGPLMHVIAAKAVAFGEALEPSFKIYAQDVAANAKVLADTLIAGGLNIVSGGTDSHMVLVDLRPKGVKGRDAEHALERAGLTCNKNAIPFDPEKPAVTSGVRLGTSAGTTRGFGQAEFKRVGELILRVIDALALAGPEGDAAVEKQVLAEVQDICARFPIYQ